MGYLQFILECKEGLRAQNIESKLAKIVIVLVIVTFDFDELYYALLSTMIN